MKIRMGMNRKQELCRNGNGIGCGDGIAIDKYLRELEEYSETWLEDQYFIFILYF